MGCFNKSCVVTGLQIRVNDKIVGIKLSNAGNNFNHITSQWHPVEFPVRGVYDDYGRIEVDGNLYEGDDEDQDSHCDNYMFIHEWAYDYIVKIDQADRTDQTDRQKAYLQELWDSMRRLFIDIDSKDRVLSSTSELLLRYETEKWFQLYFPLENKRHWFNKLYTKGTTFEEMKTKIEKFTTELASLEIWRFEFGFQWHPSYVANQVVCEDEHIGLLEKQIEYLKRSKGLYEE